MAAYTFALADPAAHTASEQLPCLTGTPPVQPGSASALSVGGTGAGAATCSVLEGRRDAVLPADARPVPGHGGHVYLGTSAPGYRLGYRSYDDPAGGSPLVLQIAVGRQVSATRVVDLLESIAVAPGRR